MRCLFINTSSFFIDVAIVDSNEVLFHRVEKIDKDMSSKIMPIIKAGFSNVNFELKNLDYFLKCYLVKFLQFEKLVNLFFQN